MDKNWRPENWEQMRLEIATAPYVWSASKKNLSQYEQMIELAADKILEEWGKEMDKPVNKPIMDKPVEVVKDGKTN